MCSIQRILNLQRKVDIQAERLEKIEEGLLFIHKGIVDLGHDFNADWVLEVGYAFDTVRENLDKAAEILKQEVTKR